MEMYKAVRANGTAYFFLSTSLDRAMVFAEDAVFVGCTGFGA